MAIITIARERGAYGSLVAHQLAEQLGAKFVDKDIIDRRLEELGIAEKTREAFDERKPGFFASLTNAIDKYVSSLKLIMFEEACGGNCVILGRASQAIFKGTPNHLSVRITASPSVRYARIADTLNISEDEAKELTDRTDHDRAGFNNSFFYADWANPTDYDMIISTDLFTPENVTEIVKTAVNNMPQTNIDTRQAMQDLAMAQRVSHHILHVAKIPVFFLNVTCNGTNVTLKGIVHNVNSIEDARKAAFIDGITSVQSKLEVGLHGHYEGHI